MGVCTRILYRLEQEKYNSRCLRAVIQRHIPTRCYHRKIRATYYIIHAGSDEAQNIGYCNCKARILQKKKPHYACGLEKKSSDLKTQFDENAKALFVAESTQRVTLTKETALVDSESRRKGTASSSLCPQARTPNPVHLAQGWDGDRTGKVSIRRPGIAYRSAGCEGGCIIGATDPIGKRGRVERRNVHDERSLPHWRALHSLAVSASRECVRWSPPYATPKATPPPRIPSDCGGGANPGPGPALPIPTSTDTQARMSTPQFQSDPGVHARMHFAASVPYLDILTFLAHVQVPCLDVHHACPHLRAHAVARCLEAEAKNSRARRWGGWAEGVGEDDGENIRPMRIRKTGRYWNCGCTRASSSPSRSPPPSLSTSRCLQLRRDMRMHAAAVAVEGLRVRSTSEVRKEPLRLSAMEVARDGVCSEIGIAGGPGGVRVEGAAQESGIDWKEHTGTRAHRAAQAAIRKCVPPGLVVNQRLPTNVREEDARSSDSVLRVSVQSPCSWCTARQLVESVRLVHSETAGIETTVPKILVVAGVPGVDSNAFSLSRVSAKTTCADGSTRSHTVTKTRAERCRAILIELAIGLGIPLLQIPLLAHTIMSDFQIWFLC
ncbi:hypothetical protein B0H13DRAFT_1896507 [Mycena leptocephala]|nr:hypothetical protein B0H13DRAFT_1896507 [Mycena leptocephala]